MNNEFEPNKTPEDFYLLEQQIKEVSVILLVNTTQNFNSNVIFRARQKIAILKTK
jgi:hypothetical protein